MKDDSRDDVGFTWLFAAGLLALILAGLWVNARADQPEQHRWTLYALVMDSTTGEPLYQAPVHDRQTNKPKVFTEAGKCVEAAIAIGPVPAHEGQAIMFRCVREDALPLPQKQSSAV